MEPRSEQPHLSQRQQQACRTSDLSSFFGRHRACLHHPVGNPTSAGRGLESSGYPGAGKESTPSKFAQLTNIAALKPSIPGLMQLNDLFPLLIAAWLTADPSSRLSSRMPGCFPAGLQLIQKPLQCMNSLSSLPTSHYLALLC